MVWLMLAVVAIVLLLLVAKQLAAKKADSDCPYQKNGNLFSAAERSFLGVLEQAAGKDIRVFGKVRVADVLSPAGNQEKSKWQSSFNKISGKHFDFLLCAAGDLSVLCAVELNDQSHRQKSRQARDDFLARACGAAGLPLISFPAQRDYVLSDVSARIAQAVSGPPIHHSD
jgi:hypothetical protein